MNKTALLVLLLAGIASASDLDITQKNSLYAGLAIPAGKGKEDKKPLGANAGFESYAQIQKYIGLGGHLEYCWQSLDLSKDTSDYIKGALHYWDIAFCFKGLTSFSDQFLLYAELAPAFYTGLKLRHTEYDDTYEWVPDFGLSLGAGAIIGAFVIGWRFKIVFTESQSTKWMTVTVGLCG